MSAARNSRPVRRNSQKALEVSLCQEYDDGRSFDPAAVQLITQSWVEKHMKNQESKFTETVQAKVFCGTWNVNSKVLKDESLVEWLCPPGSANVDSSGNPDADIYVVGFQEMVDLTVVNVAVDSKSQQRSQYWQEKIVECLNSKGGSYTQVMSKHLVGLLVCVLVKDSVLPHVRDVRSASAGVGVMGMMGNKGGVSVRLTLYDSSICVVCAHMAAHRENVAGRNADFQNIIEKTVFVPVESTTGTSTAALESDAVREERARKLHYTTGLSPLEELTIPDHDLVFWIGDLNYRIDESLPTEDVFAKIDSGEWGALRDYDQLNIERQNGTVFQGFSEGVLEFLPTYKYQPGTKEYERRAEKKLRAPAWCDRILWRANTSLDAVTQLSYQRAELLPSDHKPVMAAFQCNIRKIVKEKEKAVFQELMRELDKHENDSIPRVSVEGGAVSFGTLFFQEPKEATVRIKNVGMSIAHWRFVPKLEEKWPCKRWMAISPTLGMLLPGEEVEVVLAATIDAVTADAVNNAREMLDDIMVLRVENGQDFYITVKANFARSCFGMSLEQLVCALEPVRNIPAPAVDASQTYDPTSTQPLKQQLSIPKELWRLVDALWQGGGMREKDLFASSAEPGEVAKIRECLDTGVDFPPCSPHSIADALVTLISSLPQPLLPPDLYPTANDVEPNNIRAWSRHFLEQLPPINYNVFVYLLSFQRELLALREFNRLTAVKLSALNVACMTPNNVPSAENLRDERIVGDPDNAANVYNQYQGSESKILAGQQALHVVMVHFLTSSAI